MSLPNTADIALILVVVHVLVACLVPLVLFFFVVRGAVMMNRKTREVMPTVQSYARQMAEGAENISQRVAEPVLKIEGMRARMQGMWQQSSESFRRHPENGVDQP